ncbi:MAG: endonuclease/exonuclease/phosphatase family protein [Muribaculaceae bacterium]|nr:endonuclease/exonuclease/phosphatase family protein [Muribaculaceae bacterium]
MRSWTRRILRIVGYAASLAVAAATVCAAYGGAADPARSTAPAILAMAFPLFVGLSGAVMLAALLTRQWRMALVPALALLCSAGPLAGYAPVNLVKKKISDQDSSRVFTVMSYNVANLVGVSAGPVPAEKYRAPGAPLNEIVEYIIASGADIVVTQEFPVMRPDTDLGLTAAMIDTLATLYPHSLFPRPTPSNRSAYRCKIFSRFPLRQVELPGTTGSSEWSAAMVDICGMETLVVDVHLQSIGLTPQDKELYREFTEGEGRGKIRQARESLIGKVSRAMRFRAGQAETLRRAIDSIGARNVIVAGDFNDIPGCYAIRRIAGDDFRNAFDDAANGPMITFHSDRFYFHIDHILYRGAMEAIDLRRGGCSESDHYPVVATFLKE